MTVPVFDANATCPLCGAEAKALVQSPDYGTFRAVTWCSTGHVIINTDIVTIREVYNFFDSSEL